MRTLLVKMGEMGCHTRVLITGIICSPFGYFNIMHYSGCCADSGLEGGKYRNR